MNMEDLVGTLLKRLPHVTRYLLDPVATPIFTSPAPGSCHSGWDTTTGAAADAIIPWDVTIPHLPGWTITEKAFKFRADGSTAEMVNISWQYNPTKLVIPAGDHGLTAATDCVDVMVVIYQINNTSGKRKVAGLVNFLICGDCTNTVAVPVLKKA